MKNIPRYLSTFDLEEARLGQALDRSKKILTPNQLHILNESDLVKLILRKIKSDSVNAEFALSVVVEDLMNSKKEKAATLKEIAACLMDKLSK